MSSTNKLQYVACDSSHKSNSNHIGNKSLKLMNIKMADFYNAVAFCHDRIVLSLEKIKTRSLQNDVYEKPK